MSESLVIDTLTFELRRSPKRKSIGITIDREGGLILTAPQDCPMEAIERTAREKQVWVHTKLAEKNLFFHPSRPKAFVSGEGFFYLGRSYRLLLFMPSSAEVDLPALRLHQGRFRLRRGEQHRAQDHFVRWYTDHGRPWILRRVDLLSARVGVSPGAVEVRDLGYRWGSCGKNASLNFHWRTILLPPRIIEYIVAHELAHLNDPHHGPDFWRRLERAMPDFAMRKEWLAASGGKFSL